MDMMTTLAVPVGCFVAFVLSLICFVEIVVLPMLRNRRLGRDAQGKSSPKIKPERSYLPRQYPASGGSV